jgi:hypothetical protein
LHAAFAFVFVVGVCNPPILEVPNSPALDAQGELYVQTGLVVRGA